MWCEAAEEGSIFTAPCYGERFGMAKNRFLDILSAFRLAFPLASHARKDPWHSVRSFIDGFNLRNREALTLGPVIVIDECMCSWKGLDSTVSADTLPHATKILRKPKGVGAELKSLADGVTGILVSIDIQEGKNVMDTKPFVASHGATTGCVLRLLEPYFNTKRVVFGDSWFASVKTLLALKFRDLFFVGVIKTAHKEFPKKVLSQFAAANEEELRRTGNRELRGSCKVLQATGIAEDGVTQVPMMAVGWHDRKTKYFIANAGTTVSGNDWVRPRHRKVESEGEYTTERFDKVVKQPMVVEWFYKYFATIDIHDHYRQGSLAFEVHWHTITWWHRLFSTVLGMIVTNAFLAYRFEFKQHSPAATSLDFTEFIGKLAYELTHMSESNRRPTRHSSSQSTVSSFSTASTVEHTHSLIQLCKLEQYKHVLGSQTVRARRQCHLCKKKTAYYCELCSSPDKTHLVCVCAPTKEGSDCFSRHISGRI
jgi:hypothetical protein